MSDIAIAFNTDGAAEAIYTEAIDLAKLGSVAQVSRASHVEPGDDMKWYADMSPVGGPQLGPFDFRSEALAAEVKWLENNYIGRT